MELFWFPRRVLWGRHGYMDWSSWWYLRVRWRPSQSYHFNDWSRYRTAATRWYHPQAILWLEHRYAKNLLWYTRVRSICERQIYDQNEATPKSYKHASIRLRRRSWTWRLQALGLRIAKSQLEENERAAWGSWPDTYCKSCWFWQQDSAHAWLNVRSLCKLGARFQVLVHVRIRSIDRGENGNLRRRTWKSSEIRPQCQRLHSIRWHSNRKKHESLSITARQMHEEFRDVSRAI